MKNLPIFLAAGGIAFSVIILVALMNPVSPSSDFGVRSARMVVLATTFPLYDFTRNIGGDRIELHLIIEPGREFHEFEPTPAIVELARKARVLVFNGAGLEPWLVRLVEASGNKELILVNTSEGLDLLKLGDQGKAGRGQKGPEVHDPHVWLDPLYAKHQASKIRDALVKADPRNREFYEAGAEAYLKLLEGLHGEIVKEFSKLARRDFVVFHGSFRYFASRYNLTMHSVVGGDPHGEPSARDIARIIDLARTLGIKVVYSEPLLDTRLTEVIAEQIGGLVLVLDPLDGVAKEEFMAGASYLEKMRDNVRNLIEGLKA